MIHMDHHLLSVMGAGIYVAVTSSQAMYPLPSTHPNCTGAAQGTQETKTARSSNSPDYSLIDAKAAS